MFVHRSNRLEELVDGLHRVLSEPILGVMTPEVILIQSAGMERYLSRELARRSGITANVDFPFPRSFLRRVLDRALGEDERAAAFERENMTWSLFEKLGAVLKDDDPSFRAARAYLQGDADHSRRLLLAERLAYLFDQYVTYRPRMVLAWDEGEDADDFQAKLWRMLVEESGPVHFAARCHRFMNELSEEEVRAALPARVSLMGGPGLPPLFLQMLARIGALVQTHVFSFSVCQEYFADAHPLTDPLPEMGEGLHPLLVSLGKVGADYQHLLEMIGSYEEGSARFLLPEPRTLLTALQRCLVEGTREIPGVDTLRRAHASGALKDDSITVDSCHSPLREVEILHDRLLRWFADDPTLRPEDVVVLAPNIEAYSPLISAVFSARAGEKPHIPFRIADRSEKHTNAAARAFLLSLSVLRGRLKASEVLDLLQLEPVRARYRIDSAELERIASWVRDGGVRWGVDGKHRVELGLPEDDTNTWRFGLRRLLLGYALPDDGKQLWDGSVPLDQVSVGDIDLVGRLSDFCENLFSLRQRLRAAGEAGLGMDEWQLFLAELVDVVLAEEGRGVWDTGAVRSAIFSVTERAHARPTLAETEERRPDLRLGLRGMTHLLSSELDASRPSTDFLAGGVTFCALLPLRTIPFRRVCVLGMSQGEFPRADSYHQLDKMAHSPKRGDRSLRADDRYLFLEVLLAARERLSLSYVGRSVQDNTEKPPSVVLSELSLVIERLLGRDSATPPRATGSKGLSVRQHPLQPFHPTYFRGGDSELASFDERAFAGAQALVREPDDVAPFFGERVAALLDEEVEFNIEQLVRFWKDPTKAYLDARGVRIDDNPSEVEDREPVVETGLSRYIAGDRILRQKLRGEPVRSDVELCRGELPVGQGGRVLLDDVTEVSEEIFEASSAFRRTNESATLSIDLQFEPLEDASLQSLSGIELQAGSRPPRLFLTGSLDQIYGNVRLETSYGRLNASRKVALWIRHLALCASADAPDAPQSVMVVRGSPRDSEGIELFSLAPVNEEQARALLQRLAQLAYLGRWVPLPFFPSTSEAYFAALSNPKKKLSEDEVIPFAFAQARKELFPEKSGYRIDAAIAEVYRGGDPLGDRDASGRATVHPADLGELPFARLAESVFHPMARAITTGGGHR